MAHLIVSYHIISYHIVSYRIVSYRIALHSIHQQAPMAHLIAHDSDELLVEVEALGDLADALADGL